MARARANNGGAHVPKCWCGKPATHRIVNRPDDKFEVDTPVCQAHRYQTYAAIKWRLISLGIWAPGWLRIEWLRQV